MPLRIIAIFWSLTLALFYFDPFDVYVNAPNELLLLLFITLNVTILLVVSHVNIGILPPLMADSKSAMLFFRWSFFVSIIFLPFNIHVYTGSSLGDFTLLLSDPVQAYSRMHLAVGADRSERLSFLLVKLTVCWLTVALVPLAILLHKNRQISLPTFIGVLAVSFILSVFRGTDKELADIMIFLIGSMFINSPQVVKREPRKKLRLLSRQSLLVGAGGMVFLYFFAFRKSERLANLSVHCFQNTDVCMEYPSSEASPLGYLVMLLFRYATHGYYGLAASFDAIWTPCPLIGDSRVMQYIVGNFGLRCETTITQQLDNLGWTSVGAWSTGFTQLANNFGHVGVFFYILFFAVVLKVFHKTYARTGCYLCGIMYFLNFFILFYMPANLQLQQVGEQYFGYLVLNAVVFTMIISKQARTL